jgi:hypothetical protein
MEMRRQLLLLVLWIYGLAAVQWLTHRWPGRQKCTGECREQMRSAALAGGGLASWKTILVASSAAGVLGASLMGCSPNCPKGEHQVQVNESSNGVPYYACLPDKK